MRKIISFSFFLLLLTVKISAQSTGYYFKGQIRTVYFSNRIIFIHFAPGLTNLQKQSIIANAQLDMIGGEQADIADYVKLKSKITSGWHWVYPCSSGSNMSESIKKDQDSGKSSLMQLPCENCPDCTPRYEYYEYNNFENAIAALSQNVNIKSVSKGFSYTTDANNTDIGTEENFYIKLKPQYSIGDFSSLLSYFNLQAQDMSNQFVAKMYKISVRREDSKNIFDRANIFYSTGMCEFSTPNFIQIGKILATTDPRWTDQWNLSNTGQYNGVAGADIRIQNAWNFSKGNNVVVAVLDNGCILNHPDLAPNLLTGYDLTNSQYFTGWHGAGVAGIIAAVADNNIDITGVAPQAKVIPIKIFTPGSNENDIGLSDQIAAGFYRAIESGAQILNCSWGIAFESDLISNALGAVASGRGGKGCVLIFSSDNYDYWKPDPVMKFLSTYPGIISVGAMTHCNTRKSFTSCDPNSGSVSQAIIEWGSKFGPNLSMVAPGVRIPTINYDQNLNLTNMSGTSASAPMVSATAALILSINPTLTQQEVKRILELSNNKVGGYCYNWTSDHPNGAWNNEMGYGRLNAYNAVQLARPGVTISSPTYNVPGQISNAVTGNISIIFNGTSCPNNLPVGISFVKRYEILSNITFPYTTNPVIICSSNGFNQANPNTGSHWAEAINVTNTSATLRTYAYMGYNSLGQEIGWIPTTIQNIKFTYVVVGGPAEIIFQQLKGLVDSEAVSQGIPFVLDLKEDIQIHDIPIDITKHGVSPNPVKKELVLRFNSDASKTELIKIYNSLGAEVKSFFRNINTGINFIPLDVSNLSEGVYILKCGKSTYKFIKTN